MNFFKTIKFVKFCVSSLKMIIISNHTKNMLTFSSLIFCILNYIYFISNTYIASHLNVVRDS